MYCNCKRGAIKRQSDKNSFTAQWFKTITNKEGICSYCGYYATRYKPEPVQVEPKRDFDSLDFYTTYCDSTVKDYINAEKNIRDGRKVCYNAIVKEFSI